MTSRVTVGSTWNDSEIATLARVVRFARQKGCAQTDDVLALTRKVLRLEQLAAEKKGAQQ